MSEKYSWEKGLLLHQPEFPKTTAEYQALLSSDDLSPLEDVLMKHLETAPDDIGYYLPAYRTFIKKKEEERASTFLELHLDMLEELNDFASETVLLQALLGFWPDCRHARALVLEHLKNLYRDSAHFNLFVEHLRIKENAPALPTFRLLELWLRYDEGRIVYIPTRGVARVNEVNPKLNAVRILFKDGEKMSLQIDEAERLSESLANDHFLARILNDAATLEQIARDDPGELLRQFFASVKGERSLGELKEMLSGVITDAEWTKWWARARKDTRLITGTEKKPLFSWNDSVAEGSAVLLKAFIGASPREKISLLKKHAHRSATLTVEMAATLAEEAARSLDSDPSLALEAGITISDMPQCDKVPLPYSVNELLARKDAASIILGISNRLTRRKAVQLIAEVRDDRAQLYLELLRGETDTALLGYLYEALHTGDHDDLLFPEIERTFSLQTDSNTHFYLWLCKEIPGRTELRVHANLDLIRTLLSLIDNSSYKEHLTAMRTLFDPGEVVDRAIETLDIATCRTLLDSISRVRGLEEYRKVSVRQKLFNLYPELHEKKKELLLVTRASLDKKKVEYEKLIRVDIPHAAKEIQRTREYGDLRENFEYHEARRQQELLSSRAKKLHDDLIVARAIVPETIDTSKIGIGTRCRLQPESADDAPVTLTILGPWDSDPENNILSYTSEAGMELLNVPEGGSVVFNGKRYVVDRIEVWVE